jgi:hypothetical protein
VSVIHLVIGGRNSGKTDFCKVKVIEPCLLPKTLIVDIFDNPRWQTTEDYRHKDENLRHLAPPIKNINVIDFDQLERHKSGMYRVFSSDVDELFQITGRVVTRTNIIYEDATRYFGSTLTKDQRKIVLDSKQKYNHATFVFHTLVSPPPELIKLADVISIGRTVEITVPSKYEHIPQMQKVVDYLREQPDPHKFVTLQIT